MEALRTYDDYRKAIKKKDGIIIKFYADWCPDCTILNDFIPSIIREYKYLDWYELNRDEVPEAADENEVSGTPELLIFKRGATVARLRSHNVKTPGEVRAFLKENL